MKRFVKIFSLMLLLVCVFAFATACQPTVGSELKKVGKITAISITVSMFDSNMHLITDSETIEAALDELKDIPLTCMEEFDEEYFNPVIAASGTDSYLVFLWLTCEEIESDKYYLVALDYEGTVYFLCEEKKEEGNNHIIEVFRSDPNSIDTDGFLEKYLKG